MATLPYDYEVEYLESVKGNATALVDLGFQGNEDTDKIQLDFMMLNASAQNRLIIGKISGADTVYCELYVNGSVQYSHHRIASDQWSPATSVSVNNNKNVKLTWILDYPNKKNYFNGIWTSTFTVNGTQPTASDCYLFSNRNNGVPQMRVYELQWYRSGELIHDFIPVVKNGVGCFYDRSRGTIHTNSGSQALVIGPKIEPPEAKSFLSLTNLTYLWEKIKTVFAPKSEINKIEGDYYNA